MSSIRKRISEKKEDTAFDKLSRVFQESWEEAKKDGINEEHYIQTLRDKITKKERAVKKKKIKYCFCLFDCIWTIILLLGILVAAIAYCSPVTNFLQKHLHSKLYTIDRAFRQVFIVLRPHLLDIGLDFSQVCLIENPLVNETMKCPCIHYPTPIEVNSDNGNLPEVVLEDRQPVYIVHGIVPIAEVYGRATLLKYEKEYGKSSRACMQVSLGENGPAKLDEIINEKSWEHLKNMKEPWGFMWHDCEDQPDSAPPLHKLLPSVLPLFQPAKEESSVGVYTLTTLWEKIISFNVPNNHNTTILVVLQGRVKVKMETAIHCIQCCHITAHGVLLNEGDVVVYDKRYWTFSAQSWSEFSFTMITSVGI